MVMATVTDMVTAMAQIHPSKTLPLWDMHSHVLPGIDDGSKDWETSLQMILASWKAGVRTIVATPHHLPWKDPIPPETIKSLCEEARARFEDTYGYFMRILPGQELYYHSGLLQDLATGRCLTLNDSDTILVEFATKIDFEALQTALRELYNAGYNVIVAHLERYSCLRSGTDLVEDLLDEGILFQSNIQEAGSSLFDSTERWLRRLYENRLIQFVASDMHNMHSRSPMSLEDVGWYRKKLDPRYFREVFQKNAEEMIL